MQEYAKTRNTAINITDIIQCGLISLATSGEWNFGKTLTR